MALVKKTWLDDAVACKIGTVPMVVVVHPIDKPIMQVGEWTRVQFARGGKWELVLVRYMDDSGYFRADSWPHPGRG